MFQDNFHSSPIFTSDAEERRKDGVWAGWRQCQWQ